MLGGLSGLAFAPFFYVWLLVPAFGVLLFYLEQVTTKKQAFALGFSFGFGHFLVSLYWLANPLFVVNLPWLAPPAVTLIPAACAVYIGLTTLVTYLLPTSRTTRPIVLAIVWVFFEYWRGILFTGFPWNLLGYSLAFSDELIQLAAITGIYGLSLLVALCSSMPYLLLHQNKYNIAACTICLLTLLGVYCYGSNRLQNKSGHYDIGLRLVQANIPQTDKWQAELALANLNKHIDLSQQHSELPIHYVIWPESAINFHMDKPGLIQHILPAIPLKGALISGSDRIHRTAHEVKIWNSMHVIDHDGQILGHYDKVHLVPFGEYVPFRSILPMETLAPGIGDWHRGEGPNTIKAGLILPRFRPLICYETIFPEEAALHNLPPAWMLNLTNDGWYGKHVQPYQNLHITRLRSVEQGLPMIRSAGTGISAIIDAYGRIEKQLPVYSQGVLDGYLPMPIHYTIYSRYGNSILMIIMSCLGAIAFSRREKPNLIT